MNRIRPQQGIPANIELDALFNNKDQIEVSNHPDGKLSALEIDLYYSFKNSKPIDLFDPKYHAEAIKLAPF